MTNTQELISTKLAEAIANPIFPQLDSQLRAGRHISLEALDEHAFLMDYQSELEQFYRRYHVELIRAPEGFFYLRPKASTLIARSAMSEMEMLVGKVLCYLYLSPERLAQQGIFHYDEVYDELLNLADETKLLKAINPRSTGSDLDKAKLAEKVGGALRRLGRLGMITRVGDQNSKKFVISESVFRFGADVRTGDDPREAQLRLIRDGEATNPTAIKEQAVSFDEEFANEEIDDGEE
ncbi:chromosome partition protein MukE [Glaesserella parasuis]|uniref:chromosome partition protein MukE n=1 Tax=Glaesserella parasuis TaxID=738 RepID=UPI0021BD908F|nr:chromosome partition protein MukE [Glaesserella parasuis]MCT8785684.1 chromosome partition protein MukE [Glaesserella parasuis]MCT8788069.1 chromosome partition protein MukE [Glaesserella parasuis]MDG6267122.1 chromosome partition protein MukE [Glaesserella parasuis]MDG6297054.1 chromosome partition protein MukE [Glaesserella parasuis]MDG6447979.1 chromosome partition protein MukE [Glaesserella parasuis]